MFDLIIASSEGPKAFCERSLADVHIFPFSSHCPHLPDLSLQFCVLSPACAVNCNARDSKRASNNNLHVKTRLEQHVGTWSLLSVHPGGHKFRWFWTGVCCSTLDQSLERHPGDPSLLQRNTQELQPALSGRLTRNYEVSWELGTRLPNQKVPCSRFVYLQVENSCYKGIISKSCHEVRAIKQPKLLLFDWCYDQNRLVLRLV